MGLPTRLVCSGCGLVVPDQEPYPFRCPRSKENDDIDHVLVRVVDPEALQGEGDAGAIFLGEERNPFLRYRRLFHSYHVALSRGLSDHDYVGLVNDLLTLSRLQRGRLRLQRAEVDLWDVARSAVALAGAKAQRLGVDLDLCPALGAGPGLPAVSGDADRLQQVILNLLDNALKATLPGGTVHVEVEARQGEMVLSVLDDGRGLTAEEAARAFEPYFRGHGGGAGLGLAIAREIVEAHGGCIWLRRRPTGGAEAGFALPCPVPGEAAP